MFFVNGEDVSKEIRSPRVSNLVSFVARIKRVRERLVELQREISYGKNVILDGRDIGTVVFPNADLKVFLLHLLKKEQKEDLKNMRKREYRKVLSQVLANIKERDMIDSTRGKPS